MQVAFKLSLIDCKKVIADETCILLFLKKTQQQQIVMK